MPSDINSLLKIFLALAWIVNTSSIATASESNMLPDTMMSRLAWSLAEPIPVSMKDFIANLEEYASSINSKVDTQELQKVFPEDQLDVQYEYGIQRPNGHWDSISVVVRIKASGKPLTFSDRLLKLHQMAYKHIKNQDHHYFEGLYLLKKTFDNGVPAYELYLGS